MDARNEMSFEDITRSVRSYNGHLMHGHTWKLRKQICSNLVFTSADKKQIQ